MPTPSDISPPAPRRFQFSLGTLILWMTIAALAVGLTMTSRELSQKRQQLAALLPLTPQEVARQFAERASQSPLQVTVADVRYSAADDAYKVRFSWADPKSAQNWSSEVTLVGDHYGEYFGIIRSGPFLQAVGGGEGFGVNVKPPSSLAK